MNKCDICEDDSYAVILCYDGLYRCAGCCQDEGIDSNTGELDGFGDDDQFWEDSDE